MDQKAVIMSCRELGCCDACCLRYIGLKNPTAFENPHEYVQKYAEGEAAIQAGSTGDTSQSSEESDTPAKRMKTHDVCVSCLGILQEENWPQCLQMVEEIINKKGYECETFACALSAPIATALREKAVALHLAGQLPHYDQCSVTPLKEAWKWSCGGAVARRLGWRLESGAVAPLLVTLHLEYGGEARELDVVRALAPAELPPPPRPCTRRAAERALAAAAAPALAAAGWARPPRPAAPAAPRAAATEHQPLYLAGRYVKLSRSLPQTPWVVRGARVLPSSVQELLLAPLAALYGFDAADQQRRLKFVSAGREDVDVRCLGAGRPFAVEVLDPPRAPSPAELARLCAEVSRSGQVRVERMVLISKERLAELKRGEETKCKTYEALCIKLARTAEDIAEGMQAVAVTARDVANVSAWCGAGGGALLQRTPLRVLHRRPLLARRRRVLALEAAAVAAHPALLALRLRTEAGTYVKEWAHGDLRRTTPALAAALGAPADILALDVTQVDLEWP